jgi:hypothetical protein
MSCFHVNRKKARRGPGGYLASVDELKKTGQLTRWIDDHDIPPKFFPVEGIERPFDHSTELGYADN